MDSLTRVKKRIRVSRKPKTCPNPLFVSWLQELKDEATRKESRTQYIYSKVISLRQITLLFNFHIPNLGIKITGKISSSLTQWKRMQSFEAFRRHLMSDAGQAARKISS